MNYSFDANELITELEEDINLFGDDLIVWAYWIVMSNCQELIDLLDKFKSENELL